jgi:hypothetical protein
MLELALELREAIKRYVIIDKRYTLNPSEQEWDKVKHLVVCLKVFYDATLKSFSYRYNFFNHCYLYIWHFIMVFIYNLYYFIVLSVAENGRDFGDTIWPTDEAAPTDGVCDGEA